MDMYKDPIGIKEVSVADAFLIMEEFVNIFGTRDSWSNDGLRRLADFISTYMHQLNPVNPAMPSDPAMWFDWKEAVRIVRPDLVSQKD